jgi:glycosyltransferase involved in cell wall biosynthesis
VHIATEGPLGWSALSAADALGLPLSSSFHTNFHAYSRHYGAAFATRLVLAYLRWFHNRTRLTLSPTAELNAELTRDGFANMRLMARGVNTRVFTPAARDPALRAAWGAAPADLVVVHVSRLAAEKNYPLLFAAFDRIKAVLPAARLVIVSDGPLRKKLRRQRPDAVFTGFLPRADLARHYASADLFLYPSLTETFGNVLTESMASGLPVLAFNYAAAARYVSHDVNGLVAPFDDSVTFLDHAVALATDPARRARLAAAARLTAEGISWDSVLDALERDLHQVAGLPSPTATRPPAP